MSGPKNALVRGDKEKKPVAAHWRKFYVDVAGNTNGAHKSYVDELEVGYTQVSSLQESDYCVVFCPVTSRVGTDVNEALDREAVTVGKPVILVVMHQTFKPDDVVAPSKRLVNKANVRLTVDCLFNEGKLLANSKTNEKAWSNIEGFLGLPQGSATFIVSLFRRFRKLPPREQILIIIVLIGLFIIVFVLVKFDTINIHLSRSSRPNEKQSDT